MPRCLTGVGHHVTATGHYYPCCWVANATILPGSIFEAHEDQLDLNTHSLDEVLGSEVLRLLAASWERFDDAPRACRYHCGVEADHPASPKAAQATRENISLRKRQPPR